MKSIDFEHGLLGKVFNLSSDARTNIKGHDALLLENAEYRKLFSEFTQASQKMFKGMDPHKYDDQPHIKEWAIFFKNILRNPGARTAASQAASKLHEIYETHNAKLSAAHAADNLTNALASKRYDEALQIVAENPESVNAKTSLALTPLLDAILRRDNAGIDFLLAHNADPLNVRVEGMNAINWAMNSRYDFSLVEKLVDAAEKQSARKNKPAAAPKTPRN